MTNRIFVRLVAAIGILTFLGLLLFPGESETEIDELDDVQFDMEPDSAVSLSFSRPHYRFAAAQGGAPVADTSLVAGMASPNRGGRNVVISICGVDSRVGEQVEHADANHVLVVWLDSGMVDVLSIPRGTPADAGSARPALNILANVRSYRGRDAYLKEVAAIAGVDTIHYYIDFGFSQARGLLETLGFAESGKALKLLRARQVFQTGDYQRSYNQGQFIRQTLLRRFDDLDGFAGGLLLRAGLALVNTNLTMDAIDGIASQLRKRGFPAGPQSVQVFLRPDYHAKMAVYDFADSTVLGSLLNRVNDLASQGVAGPGDTVMSAFRRHINLLLDKAAVDTASRPQRVVALLRRPFGQRVWWQLDDTAERERVRTAMGTLLAQAYRRTGDTLAAENVRRVVEREEEL